MNETLRWKTAQKTEKDFWNGIVCDDQSIQRVLQDNEGRALLVRASVPRTPQVCLEIGVGPIGLGISGFLPEIPSRLTLDPLPPVSLEARGNPPLGSSEALRAYIRQRRANLCYIVGRGEEIPVRSESMDLIICSNVIDHAANPAAILQEAYRALKSDGTFFFDVDTFSVLGLAKWHSWTKYAHSQQILVKAHPHRMYEPNLLRMSQSCGFRLQKLEGHTLTSNWIGHARKSTFVGLKCQH